VRRLRATKPLLATDDRLLYIVDSMSYIEGYNSNSLETLFEQRQRVLQNAIYDMRTTIYGPDFH
jgi:hypothetical protein